MSVFGLPDFVCLRVGEEGRGEVIRTMSKFGQSDMV